MSAFYGFQPSLAYYKGTGATVTTTSAGYNYFPTSFPTTLTNVSSAVSFTTSGLKFTIPTSGTYTISFSIAPSSGSPAITSVLTTTSAGTGGAAIVYYQTGFSASGWSTYIASGVATAGEVWTVCFQSNTAGGAFQIGIFSIVQNSRFA